MAWEQQRARTRIRGLISTVPQIDTSRYADDYLPNYLFEKKRVLASGGKATAPLVNLKKGKAVIVDTVQIYISITNYDDFRLNEGVETEESHSEALEALHLYYSLCDRVVENLSAQRVDYHGSRLHSVILDDTGEGINNAHLEDAFVLVELFQEVARQASQELQKSGFIPKFRVGIDTGVCVAINNGTGDEQEPMFLGSAANHAAKLADGTESGIFISDNVRVKMGQTPIGPLDVYSSLSESIVTKSMSNWQQRVSSTSSPMEFNQRGGRILGEYKQYRKAQSQTGVTPVTFNFSRKSPPLSRIKYSHLSPSNSIRMEMVSIYADICGYTAYIDQCIHANDIRNAVKALYVMRAEFQNVVEKDFGGRKVRFIGDCIHAVLAEGDDRTVSERSSVSSSISCAGALRSSFKICQDEILGLDNLGLSVGLEIGPTPITRIGIRGERAVRVASSISTTVSERMQREGGHNDIKIGPRAWQLAPIALTELFDNSGLGESLFFHDVANSLPAPATITNVQTVDPYDRPHGVEYSEPPRAHSNLK